ncbi:hypothetical protein AB1Y20_011932 [Prymnesium parvum]|uniref:Phospholipase B-like n=1 Tax=Prymnesium parvum TaxID=97485 RepID=A0AB34INB6_PRYPA
MQNVSSAWRRTTACAGQADVNMAEAADGEEREDLPQAVNQRMWVAYTEDVWRNKTMKLFIASGLPLSQRNEVSDHATTGVNATIAENDDPMQRVWWWKPVAIRGEGGRDKL